MSKFSWAKFRYKSAFNSFSTTPPAAWVREGEFSLLPPPPTLNNLKENQLLGMGAREGGFSPTPNPLRVLSQINSPGRQWGRERFPLLDPLPQNLAHILYTTGYWWRLRASFSFMASKASREGHSRLLLCAAFVWLLVSPSNCSLWPPGYQRRACSQTTGRKCIFHLRPIRVYMFHWSPS